MKSQRIIRVRKSAQAQAIKKHAKKPVLIYGQLESQEKQEARDILNKVQ